METSDALSSSEVIKASPAIQKGQDDALTTAGVERAIANAYDELPNREIHRVSVAELARKLGYAG